MKKEKSWEERRKHCMKWSVISSNNDVVTIIFFPGMVCLFAWLGAIGISRMFIYFSYLFIVLVIMSTYSYYEETFYNIVHQRVTTRVGYVLQTYEYRSKLFNPTITTSKKNTKVIIEVMVRGKFSAPAPILGKNEESIIIFRPHENHNILRVQRAQAYELERLLSADKLNKIQKARYRRLKKLSKSEYYSFDKKLMRTLKQGDKIAISCLTGSDIIVDVEVLETPRLEDINTNELLEFEESIDYGRRNDPDTDIREKRKRESCLVTLAVGFFLFLLATLVIVMSEIL